MSDTKTCTKCKKTKAMEDFCTDRSRKSGLTSWCKACRKISKTKYNRTERGKQTTRAHTKRYYMKNGGTKFRAGLNLKYLYGITPADFDRMYVEQNGRCAICGKHQSDFKRALDVDHDHETKVIRGLLCRNCNLAIGKFKDNPVLLRKAADYLEGLI